MAAELDSLDGRKDPQRCTLLVSQFRSCQVSRGGRARGRRWRPSLAETPSPGLQRGSRRRPGGRSAGHALFRPLPG